MHNSYLLAALEQAQFGRGFCSPNPSVGAVAVHEGRIVGEAWHQGAGSLHAEQLLLQKIPPNLDNLTIYVTLEPCNHWGKTPPCVDSIIDYGVKRVVYAHQDPNPVVAANNTPQLLQSHGIEVIHHPIQAINDFYESYCFWTKHKRPWVTAKLAQSLDGKIAGARQVRTPITNQECAQFTHEQRKQSDVIITTARTVNQDNPLLNVRLEGYECTKPVAIIDRKGTLDSSSAIFKTAQPCLVFHGQDFLIQNPHPKATYFPTPSPNHRMDLCIVLAKLGEQGYHDAWVEAGAELFNALHRADLVNRTYIYIAPKLLGPDAYPGYLDSELLSKPHNASWRELGDNRVLTLDWSTPEESPCLPV